MDVLSLDEEVGAWDSVLLDPLTQEAFIANLHQRFKRDHIYTYIGNVLVSINPYKKLALYSKDLVKAYRCRGPYQLPPHVYAVAGSAYRALRDRNEDQCIILSGESGSGKTEAAKLIVQFLTQVTSGGSPDTRIMRDRLVQAGVLLEAFGNAKTYRNDNASRFGKYVDVEFDYKGDPLGGAIRNYLLEKSRVTSLAQGDRNFHIFYQLLSGADIHLLKTLKLQRNIDNYCLLATTVRNTQGGGDPGDDKRDFSATKKAMEMLGLSYEDIVNVLKIVAAVLKLGNVVFVPTNNIDGTEGCTVSNDYELVDAELLLGTLSLVSSLTRRTLAVDALRRRRVATRRLGSQDSDDVFYSQRARTICSADTNYTELYETCGVLETEPSALQCALTCRVLDDSSDCLVTDLSAAEATQARDSLCKALYTRLFTYLVSVINESVKVKRHGRRKLVGMLDMYGFEVLERNGFEQLIINYCNEKLHQMMAQLTLKEEQEDYVREGIEWVAVECSTHTICDLIDKNNHGILSLLDEECLKSSPKADELYLSRVTSCLHCEAARSHGATPCHNNLPASCFRLKHFAGTVTYCVTGFTERNRDQLSRDLSHAMYHSGHPLAKVLFPEGNPKRACLKRPATTSQQFRTSLSALLRSVQQRHLHYVRCIKPNELKQPRIFEPALVQHQVRYQGLVEMVRVRRQGFCHKVDYQTCLARYKMISVHTWPSWEGLAAEGVAYILRDLPIPQGEFAFGHAKLFVRSPRTVFELEEFRRERLHDLATCIQKTWRCFRLRTLYQRMRMSQIIIASAFRSWRECRIGIPYQGRRHLWCLYRVAREEYRILKHRKQVEWAVSVIQRYFVKWKQREYLFRLSRQLPADSESPICREWPHCDPRLHHTSQLLMKIHHKWRCHKYRLRFDQTARNRMREKVTASIIFKERKASYPRSVSHPFVGDYVRLRGNVQWKKMCSETNDQYVVFADIINKITRSSGRLMPILFVLSTNSMLILDQRTLHVKYRVPASEIYRLSLSPYLDDVAVFHVRASSPCSDSLHSWHGTCEGACHGSVPTLPRQEDHTTASCLFQSDLGRKKGDFVFQTEHVIEIVTKLFLVVQNAMGKPPEVNISTDFEANFGSQTVLFTFKCMGLPDLQPGQIRIVRKGSRMEVLV